MKLFLNCLDNPTTLNKKNYLLRAAQRLGIENVIDINKRKEDEPTDYVLNIEPFNFIKGNIWTGIWEIDLLLDRAATGPDWPYADTIFIADLTLPKRCEGLRWKTQLLLQACDPTLYYPEVKKTHDFAYGGSMHGTVYGERVRLYDLLKPSFTFFEAHGGQDIERYLRTISAAKIQFIRSMNSEIGSGELAQRFFECLAIGPVLTNWTRELNHTGLVEGEDYLAYRNDQEMLENMRHLTTHPGEAERIAKNGRQKALMYHTYENRLLYILNYLKEWYQL